MTVRLSLQSTKEFISDKAYFANAYDSAEIYILNDLWFFYQMKIAFSGLDIFVDKYEARQNKRCRGKKVRIQI